MNASFRAKEVKKEYWAVVEEKPPFERRRINQLAQKNQEKNKSRAYDVEVKQSIKKPF